MLLIWGLSEPGSDGNEKVFCIPKSFSITGVSPSDCLMSYPGPTLEGSYPSVEMQSVKTSILVLIGKYYRYLCPQFCFTRSFVDFFLNNAARLISGLQSMEVRIQILVVI